MSEDLVRMQAEESSDQDQLLSPGERADMRLLVVDDDPANLESCESVLKPKGYQVECFRKGEEAVRSLKTGSFQIALIDQNMPKVNGLAVLEAAQEHGPATLCIMMTGYATAQASVRALQAGAWDYLPKPFTATQLLVLVDRAAHTVQRMRKLGEGSPDVGEDGVLVDNGVRIFGVSDGMKAAVRRALKVAPTDASVFISGESGTGKELFARCIHLESRRANRSFVAINCAAIPGELLESEMFGHRKGAFTGAVREKAGLLETADQGTCFLDELSEMPVSLQPKLLRVLQDGVLRKVGSEKDDTVVDVRFISATNRNLEEALDQGLLRHDLYYRLRVVPIELPPLRDRPEDIPVMANHLVRHYWRRHSRSGGPAPRLSPAAMEKLMEHSWPGNVRELQNVLEQSVVLTEADDVIGADALPDLGSEPGARAGGAGSSSLLAGLDLQEEYHDVKDKLVSRFEKQYLARAISRAGGNMSEAARQAGIDRTTLYRLMEKHDLSKESLMGEVSDD